MLAKLKQISPSELEQIKGKPKAVWDFIFPKSEEGLSDFLDIDSAWQAIHYLLTGDIWENDSIFSDIIMGGSPIGQDEGNGPPRFLVPERVKQISEALGSVSREDLGPKFDPQTFMDADVYPFDWDEEGEVYVLDMYDSLKSFYWDATEKGNAILFCIY